MARVECSFETEVRDVTLRLREHLRGLTSDRLTQGSLAVDLHSKFGVDRRLAWMASKLLGDPNPFEAARCAPGKAGLRRLARRLSGAEASGGDIPGEVEASIDAFFALVERYAGRRETFDLMLAGLTTSSTRDAEAEQRRAACDANSFIYGAQADLQTLSCFLVPSPGKPGWIDVAYVRGLCGLRRLRPEVAWPLMCRPWLTEKGELKDSALFAPLEPGDEGGPPMLRSFCEPRGIDVDAVEVKPGVLEYVLPACEIGNPGKVTCLLGEVRKEAGSVYQTQPDSRAEFGTRVLTPVSSLLIDYFVHEELGSLGMPSLKLCSTIHRTGSGFTGWAPSDELDPLAEVVPMGRSKESAVLHEAPWYGGMADHVAGLLGHGRGDFELYRTTVPHPPLSSHVTHAFWLTAQPPGGTGG